MLLSLIAGYVTPSLKALHQGLLFTASIMFALGFAVWCKPAVQRVWENSVARLIVIVPHLLVILLAAGYARNVVSSALGLPPQDFDVTVGLLTLVFYVPIWSLIVSFVVGVVAVLLYMGGLLIGVFQRPFSESVKLFGQAGGAFAICFYSSTIFDFAQSNQESIHPFIKWVALYGDFQTAPLYPGIGPQERVRLHENGVISSASVENNTVVVRVKRYEH